MGIIPLRRHKRHITGIITIIIAAGSLSSFPVQAAEELPAVIVTAGRIAEDPARVSADVTVIGESEIRKAQASTVSDILRRQVGLHIASTGGVGKSTSLYMRGGNSKHTLVLVDGVRVGSASLGAFDWSLMSTDDIERIEIVRGPQSSLYGGDAMSGVVQIFTKTGEGKPKFRINGEAGGLATASGSMQVSGSTEEGISYALTSFGKRTSGISVASRGTERDPFRETQFSGRVSAPLGHGSIELTARRSEGKNSLDNGGSVPSDNQNWTSTSRQSVYSVKYSYPLLDMWESSLQLSRSSDDVTGVDPITATNNSDIHTTIKQLNWQNHIELADFSLLFGLDYHADRAVNPLAPLNKVQKQSAGFAALSWHSELLDLNGSLRHDRNSGLINSANKSTWHTGAVLHPLTGLKISGNYGTGFKAPSINDLYWPAVGNANLKPETSKGWDAGIAYDYSSDQLQGGLSATWFDQSFRDLIAWAPITPGSFTWIPSNVNKARSRGLEISGRVSYSGAYLQANWSYLMARDSSNETWLARRPKESGNILLGIDIGPLNLEGNLAIVGPRFSSPNNAAYLASYRKTDLRARLHVNETWELTARVNNVEDKKYEEAAGYGVAGRVWYAGLGATF